MNLIFLFFVAITPYNKPLQVEDCVRIALESNGLVAQSTAKAQIFEARLAQIESVYYPKINATFFVAPMFTVKGDATRFERDWKSISNWGPYTKLQSMLIWPLYSFGRVEAGKQAAQKRLDVERARIRETENMIALEVRKFYTMRLYALSMLPALEQASEILKSAIVRAQKLYDQATGEVSQSDLMRLQYGNNEIARFRLLAENGAKLATAALKHSMGMPEETEVEFSEDRLLEIPETDTPNLTQAIAQSVTLRPEWQQIESGTLAAEFWEKAEKLANWPILAAAGLLDIGWTPTREDSPNPYVWDPYNQIIGGVALALKWDFDPALSSSKAAEAHATREQVEALGKFASTGIPLQVRKAFLEAEQNKEIVALCQDSVSSTRKWMTFAASAYGTGAGEARDLLEGLVAYLQAKRTYYESLQNYYIARAELDFAIGIGKRS